MKIKLNIKHLILTIMCLVQTHQFIYGQEDIEFIHGKWDLEKEIRNGKIVFDGPDTTEMENGMLDIIHPRYIHFLRGNLGESGGGALSNLLFDEKDFGLRGYAKMNLYDSIRYTYANKVLNGYTLDNNTLMLSMSLRKIDEHTIEFTQYTTNSYDEETKTVYILKRDENVSPGLYLPFSPKSSIILRQNEDNYYASNIGSSEEKVIQLKKKEFSIIINSIPRKTDKINFGIHIVFSESRDSKKEVKQKLNQEKSPFLEVDNYFEHSTAGYNHLNISKVFKTHFLYYANDKDYCGEPIGSWMNSYTEWKINTFQIDGDYQVKKKSGSIKKLPYLRLYMHVFFDSNQNGIIEKEEYSCTELLFE